MTGRTRREFVRRAALASASAAAFAAQRSTAPIAGTAEGEPEPLQRKGVPKKVLVAGAGLAGLCAAYELQQAGHHVTVLEARDRPGGRVLTLRSSFSQGLWAEAGAETFGDSHRYVQRYVRQFGLPLMPAPGSSRLANLFYMNGRRLQSGGAGFTWPVDLPPDEEKLGWYDLMRKYVEPAVREIGDPLSAGWPSADILERFDRIPVAEMLRQRGASPAAVAVLQLGYSDAWDNGTGPDSALCLLRDHAIGRDARSFQRIAGGNDRLPKALAAKLGGGIHYRTVLTRIEQSPRQVILTVEESGRRHKLSGDYLVCAIPFTVLRSIQTAPAFSPGKQRAIQDLAYISVTRVFVETRTRYWTSSGLSGYAASDLPIRTVWDCSEGEPGNSGILECYMSGDAARRMGSLSEPQRVRTATENLEILFPGLHDNFTRAVSVPWDADPLARGAFAWFKAGQMSALMPHVASREGRVFFAGEHTSPWFGWMQGALQSGVRVAREVNEA